MSLDVGFDTQVPSLPHGGGAIAGIGESFTPDLSTGTGSFAIRLDLPNGPNDIAPHISLQYDTAAGNGPFGMGFNVVLPRLVRSTARGFPRYDAGDNLLLEGAGDLVRLGEHRYRLQVDGGAWRVEALGQGFRLIDHQGTYYSLGSGLEASLVDASSLENGATAMVYAWHLERIEDSIGNVAEFGWLRDGNQLYLSSLSYGVYRVLFEYEQRPDVIRWGRAGFLVTTRLRCSKIELLLPTAPQPLLRRWSLAYEQHAANGCSLLSQVTLSGFDEEARRLDAPMLRIGYSSFMAPTLTRFRSVDDAAVPGTLSGPTRRSELIDWTGNGLPDLLQITDGGLARVWPNLGGCVWGHPQVIANLPLFASANAAVAFVDMNGDGAADLIRADRPIDGYIPRIPGRGFDQPISWSQAPAMSAGAANVRLVDLNGDGTTDMLESSPNYLSLYYRSDPKGWAPAPQLVPRTLAPDVDLGDRTVFMADMTGDGSADVVRVARGTVTYWPYLGDGRWGQAVAMDNTPQLPYDARPERLFFSDLDGDGCADLIYLDATRVLYWINQAGNRFSSVQAIDFVPTGQMSDVRMADMRGSGCSGIFWSTRGALDGSAAYFYLDFAGDAKPYLLTNIDNGVGLRTRVEYTTSALEATRDAHEGQPWRTFLPLVVPLVARASNRDVTGRVATTEFSYHDGHYNGALREFEGFGRVDRDDLGDSVAPTLRTTTWFHVGLERDHPDLQLSETALARLRGLRGRVYRQERYGLDGSPQQSALYDRLDQEWTVVLADGTNDRVVLPRLVKTIQSTFERSVSAVALITKTNVAWDANNNVTESVEASEVPGHQELTHVLRTVTSFAADAHERFIAKPWRVQQFDGSPTRIADTITLYDHFLEGRVGSQGLITKRSALVLSDALIQEVYGAHVPDFAALGYYRRHDESGWWVDLAAYHRSDDSHGLHATVTGPMGAVTTIAFDRNKTYPTHIVDPRGNEVVVQHDYRTCKVSHLTDASSAHYQAVFDGLARQVASIEPGDSPHLPTATYEYLAETVPVRAVLQRRAVSGHSRTLDTCETFDGNGSLIERRIRDDDGEIVTLLHTYSARGFLSRAFREQRLKTVGRAKSTWSPYHSPDSHWLHTGFAYDALGRVIRQNNPDGSFRQVIYGPLMIEEHDEEDTRTGAHATHAGTPTRKLLDAGGRIHAVEQNQSGRWIVSHYRYDAKGNLVSRTDAAGEVVRMWYDFLGRTVRVDRAEGSNTTVFDAAGNAVEARGSDGIAVFREFDENNRPRSVRFSGRQSPPAMQFTYHDTGHPAPPEAGSHTKGGRCVRIEDEGGTTIFDYDARGRIALKRSKPRITDRTYDLSFDYRADGQLASVVYPDEGRGRTRIRYEYNGRGLLVRIPSFIKEIKYNVAGNRTSCDYANGVRQTFKYEPHMDRLQHLSIVGSHGSLREITLRTDLVGNVVRIDSHNIAIAASYTYDDLYRLTNARLDSDASWSYRYDDVGNIVYKSDVGAFLYGEHGAPSTCLTTAGKQTFTYTLRGEMLQTPWGTMSFDPLGRLARISRGPGRGTVAFRYDYAGQRVATSTDAVSAGEHQLTPDPLYSIESGVLVLNVSDGETIIARQSAVHATAFLHYDHLGSLVVVTDVGGHATEGLRYDPWGSLLERTGTGPPPIKGFIGGEPEPWSGLLYLRARYYHPSIGRFISPDSVVQDALDPLSWMSFSYARDNPTTLTDPSGHGFWDVILGIVGVLAIAGLIAATILTAGSLALVAGISVEAVVGVIATGAVLGGIVGGYAAYAHGGDAWSVILGAVVGAAVGGWASLFTLVVGPSVVSAIGIHGFGAAVVAGAVNGSISGAAIGLAAGYAGGRGSLDDVLSKVWQGALAGLVTGAVVGGLSYEIAKPAQASSQQPQTAKVPSQPQAAPGTPGGQPYANTVLGAGKVVGTGVVARLAGWLLRALVVSPVGQTIIVDSVAGVWDLNLVPAIIEAAKANNVQGNVYEGTFNNP